MFALKTKKATLNTLIFFIFANQHIFGEVIVLRGLSKNRKTAKFICLSEDDGSALVLNFDLNVIDVDKEFNFQFNLSEFNNNEINCKMNANEGCLESWTKDNWKLTDSLKTPMGPVFDQRWEEFEQYVIYEKTHISITFNLDTEIKLPFSFRTSTPMHILLCNDMNSDLCYRIFISEKFDQDIVRKCEKELSGKLHPTKCEKDQTNSSKILLSEDEWRTLIFEWNPVMQTLIIYNIDGTILTYTDEEKDLHHSYNYHMFIRSNARMFLRFHIYDFLYTTVDNAILTSPAFQLNEVTICVQLLIGLCAECDAHVVLLDVSDNEVLEKITVRGSSKVAIHGLPMWQSIKIKSNSINYSNYSMKIQMKTKLNDKRSLNPLWAIANVRQCPQNGVLRKGEIVSVLDWNSQTSDYFWPNVICQKLFYDEHTVVSSTSRVKSYPNLDDANCSEGTIGPQCLLSCQKDLDSANDCMGSKICYVDGCTCTSGFLRDNCSEPCGSNTYGYNCKKTCGSCFYRTSEERCNKVTGECSNGCINTKEVVYVPPLCQTSVDRPDGPSFISTEKTIYATVPMIWKNEYEKISIFYSFTIKEESTHKYKQTSWSMLFRNMTYLVGYFQNLNPATNYQIRCSLRIADLQIHSDWKVAVTKCILAEDFNVTSEENGIIINWRINSNQNYSCPGNWYSLVVQNIQIVSSEVVKYESVMSFPYKLQGLMSDTSFVVIILHKNHTLFSREIRTLEGIPSKVLDLRSILLSNTEFILTWNPPHKPNGKIIQYEIIIMINEFHGCRDLKQNTPDNHVIIKNTTNTFIRITDIHPYTSFKAQVKAQNSRYSSRIVETIFNTTESEIPSEEFSRLRVQEWKLSWDPPKDCTTITGPIKAKINIRGLSDAVKDFNVSTTTPDYFLDLYKLYPKLNNYERYVATVYVIRDNSGKEYASAHQTYEFETPPKAPPRVKNLEVVEVDTRQTPVMIHLRWQSPRPPLNGKLHHYGIRLCDNEDLEMDCSVTEVQLNESCDLWDNYICKVVQSPEISLGGSLEVFAYNMNVTDPGPSVYVTDLMILNDTPDEPRNITYTINNHSVVDFNWLHPWKAGNQLKSFRINIEVISSNLREPISPPLMNESFEYSVIQYMSNYSQPLYLLPSTIYNISIEAVTVINKSSNPQFEKIHTPSTATFDGMPEVMKNESDFTILLNISRILNDTRDSMMYIIVKGPILCEDSLEVSGELRARADLKINEDAWLAANVSSSKFAGNQFRFGDNKIYGNAKNCPLKFEESYEIVIIVTEGNSSVDPIMLAHSIRINAPIQKLYVAWLIFILSFFVVSSAAFCLYRSKNRQKRIVQLIQAEMDMSHDIEIYEIERNPMILNSEEDLSNRHSLSQALRSEPSIAITHDNKEKDMISLVEVKNFEDYVRQAIQSGLLDEQYKTFPKGQIRTCDYGKLTQNNYKNRYENFIAYDETRVILKTLPDDVHSDYINANYITGCGTEKSYIATQGPKPSTIVDFWRMIWQESVLIICMLVNLVENGKTICEQYWPDIGKRKKYGDIIVLNAKHNVFADYCFRTFYVTCGEETRKIEHLHYTGWPDHGVPSYTHSIVTYLKKLVATSPGDGPVVVHCSAGTGRTGTIILCDMCLHRAATEGSVDIFTEMASIASKRTNLVDNKQQYILAHLVIVEYLFSISTTLTCNDMLMSRIKKLLPVQQQRLQNVEWQDEALRQDTSPLPLSERNRAKNRFPELILDNVNRIYLKKYPASDEDSDYLSAVYVDGVKLQNRYLATQLPMPSTINDFWRMIAEFKVKLILMLQSPDIQDPTCCAIAPASGKFKPVPYLNIILEEVVEMEYYTSQKLLLVDKYEKPSRKQSVTILRLTEWKSGKNQPPPPVMMMITFWQAAEKIASGDGPTVMLCHDGVTGCGLYLAMSFLLERMAIEKECDVYLAVQAIRRSRPDFVCSVEHLEYLCEAAVTYLECFKT